MVKQTNIQLTRAWEQKVSRIIVVGNQRSGEWKILGMKVPENERSRNKCSTEGSFVHWNETLLGMKRPRTRGPRGRLPLGGIPCNSHHFISHLCQKTLPESTGPSKHRTDHTDSTSLYMGTTTPHQPFFPAAPGICVYPTRPLIVINLWWN